jgi:hypothetical protein
VNGRHVLNIYKIRIIKTFKYIFIRCFRSRKIKVINFFIIITVTETVNELFNFLNYLFLTFNTCKLFNIFFYKKYLRIFKFLERIAFRVKLFKL